VEQPGLAPLYDVSSVLLWADITQTFAQDIAGELITPDMIERKHWNAIARSSDFGPGDIRDRVRDIVGQLVMNNKKVTAEVAALPGASKHHVTEVAEAVERNARGIAERLR